MGSLKHEKTLIELVMFAALAAWALSMVGCVTYTGMCKEESRAQLAYFKSKGIPARVVHLKNPAGSTYKYHDACEIQINGKWGWWVSQPRTWTATRSQPGIKIKLKTGRN